MDHRRKKHRQDNKSSYFPPADSTTEQLMWKRVEHFTYCYDGTEK